MSQHDITYDTLTQDVRRTEFVCVNCSQVGDDVGECFGHPDAEPGWPVFHTAPDGSAA